jgi:hypothetical protein
MSTVFDLIVTFKRIVNSGWPDKLNDVHDMHLSLVLNMLKYSNFDSKINSLKEVLI